MVSVTSVYLNTDSHIMQLISDRKIVCLTHEKFLVDNTAHCSMILAVIHRVCCDHLQFVVIDLQNVSWL